MSQFTDHHSISSETKWDRSEDMLLERAILIFPEETPNRWSKIVSQIPGKSAMDVLEHYKKLIQDVNSIEFGCMDQYIPELWDSKEDDREEEEEEEEEGGRGGEGEGRGSGGKMEKKKGTPWTEEEHVLFLEGLMRYGKGDWKSISRQFVRSRTPSQVASHAQKYFARKNHGNVEKKRKRNSILDITTDHLPPLGGGTP